MTPSEARQGAAGRFGNPTRRQAQRGDRCSNDCSWWCACCVREAAQSGQAGGQEVTDVMVALVDGSTHAVDSSELAFKNAGFQAMREALRRAGPVLLEPVCKLEVVTPEEYLGDVLGQLNARRAEVHGTRSHSDGTHEVYGMVPLAETFGYATDLRSATQGRATYSMEFEKYQEAPRAIADTVIKGG